MQLEIRNLTVARGGIPVLEGVTLTLPPGQALLLRGPNGLGKTSLLRTICGLQPALTGEIACPPESLAYASHADGLKSALTVTENLAFWAEVFGTGAPAVAPALERMDLARLRHRPAAQLSAGQKRRLGLARLLVTGRPVWLLDEPTVSLDTASVARFAGVVSEHLGQGGSALIVTHADPGLAAATLDLSPFRAKTRSAGVFG